MFLWFITYILIPAYTILFVQDSNWFTTNFSVIGNNIGRQEEFVLWGLIIGIYFYWHLRKIVSLMQQPKAAWLIPLSLTLLTFAITTPYLPSQFPLKSFLHVIFAFMAAVCLAVCILFILRELFRQEPQKYRPYLIGLAAIVVFSVLLLLLAGIISSALEIFFTIAFSVMVRRLYLLLKNG